MFLHRAQLRRADERIAVLVGEVVGNLDLQVDLVHHAAERIAVDALDDADAVGRDAALTAEAEDVDPAQVPIEDRKTAKGVGAEEAGGWSVGTVNPPKWASTREPPGKSMIISM
jgi:hypothetical protein